MWEQWVYNTTYGISTKDVDVGDVLTITDDELPNWLELTDYGAGTALISGTPSSGDAGSSNSVSLKDTGILYRQVNNSKS
ncbi:hypothetical protein ACFLXF_00400 [Chloroflexota bacterium]